MLQEIQKPQFKSELYCQQKITDEWKLMYCITLGKLEDV